MVGVVVVVVVMSYRVIVDHLLQALGKFGETGLWQRKQQTQSHDEDKANVLDA